MDNTPAVQPNSNDAVWISREEYDRLRAKDAVVGSGPSYIDEDRSRNNKAFTVATVILAVLTIFVPFLAVFLIPVAIAGILKSRHSKSTGAKAAMGIASLASLVIGVVVIAPAVFFIGIILLWQLNCSIDPSACRSV